MRGKRGRKGEKNKEHGSWSSLETGKTESSTLQAQICLGARIAGAPCYHPAKSSCQVSGFGGFSKAWDASSLGWVVWATGPDERWTMWGEDHTARPAGVAGWECLGGSLLVLTAGVTGSPGGWDCGLLAEQACLPTLALCPVNDFSPSFSQAPNSNTCSELFIVKGAFDYQVCVPLMTPRTSQGSSKALNWS